MTVQLVCPLCRTPLPVVGTGGGGVLTCGQCAAEVDVSRAGTGAGRPRFLAEVDRTGQVVGGIHLEARIGMGGMGTVYRGSVQGEGRAGAVAVKFLTPALAGEPDVVARFRREMELLRGLHHPGIVRLLDHGTADGVPWFAMELCQGPDLKTRLGDGPLSRAELARIFAMVLDALEHAHARGVIHRDIKPGNVLLQGEGAKLADFGVALPVDPGLAAATRLTETAAIIGTLPYMSPEQRAGGALDRRSDLFSVGVVLYEAATGTLPLGAFPPPSRINRALPAAFDRVLHRLLQPRREARFDTAAQAGQALAAALRERAVARKMIVGGAAATLAAAIGLGIPALSHRSGQEKAEAGGGDEKAAALPTALTQGLGAGIRVKPGVAAPTPQVAPNPPPPVNLDAIASTKFGAKSKGSGGSGGKKAKVAPVGSGTKFVPEDNADSALKQGVMKSPPPRFFK